MSDYFAPEGDPEYLLKMMQAPKRGVQYFDQAGDLVARRRDRHALVEPL